MKFVTIKWINCLIVTAGRIITVFGIYLWKPVKLRCNDIVVYFVIYVVILVFPDFSFISAG